MIKPEDDIHNAIAAADVEEPSMAVAPANSVWKPLSWAKSNLFDSVPNTVLTLLALLLLWETVPPLLSWGLFNATWSVADGTAAACRDSTGACWALMGEKNRLMLFGVYPYDQHWRPLLATAIVIAMLATSALRRFWRPALGYAWLGTVVVVAWLMWGGFFGLTYVETAQWGGLPLTLGLALLGIVLAFPLSIVLALGRRSNLPAIKAICTGYIELVRGVPLVSVLFMASVMFPLFLPEGVTIDKLLRALAGMTLFTAAYLAEAVRGGLQAIPRGQEEAADALGLSYWRKMRLIVLPQALRLVIPPIVNQFISCFKDTSLVTIVGLYDLLAATKAALADPEWRPFFVEGYVAAALVYWCFCFFMSRYSQWLERELATGTRR
ncbi:amino acid ABC transporter permease [Magnetospirillum gryphiswaldense]|uniref:Binding-protein-dependent transport system inner membrane component n=1 Tax=Magnetospirillum gryphiswaldense TaxID=55518 RepID=A4TZE3_9PROT|nr:Inner membrane amino-acid ABC transporter permease protein YhdY [Magnetospirillum gryphiswaldense MSR-1]AVM78528.1 Inner membrane amino-acid ABC transporter permease protein YhdY [Magnetospirillum gryphiswaldense]CAM76000.1 binding-protein-dependent transport system inner membrane component [Magnetospirillum gryphiswaldense MSR-1]